ncbi:MAG: FtsX-like permease family protein [Peptococcaceae bacterium]|nr:FtsX-like permease family protein [Peptococcaceae bacterium]
MAAVLGTIIVVTSVIVISSAFRISAGERTRQFGILKSVGATKKQIAQTVLYEGVFLCVAGIPCGVALGLAVELGATSIGERLLQNAGSVAHFFSCSRPPRFCSRRRSRSARYCSRHGFPRAKPQG